MFSDVFMLLQHSPITFYVTITILGLIIGSFLNVVIYRLPKMLENEWFCECRELLVDELTPVNEKKTEPTLTLSKPASTCPKCGHKIKVWENIPVISWLLLKGKCSACANPISARYPIIETLTGIASLVIAMHFGVSWQMLFMLV